MGGKTLDGYVNGVSIVEFLASFSVAAMDSCPLADLRIEWFLDGSGVSTARTPHYGREYLFNTEME